MKRITIAITVLMVGLLLFTSSQPSRAQGESPQSEILPSMYAPGDDTPGPAAGIQMAPSIARGGDSFLVAWSDQRSHPDGFSTEYETSSDIYALRLDSNGEPLDSQPFVVTQARGGQLNPKIAWNGSNWLVVFESYGLNGTGYYFEKSLAVMRVAPDGQVLDPEPVIIFGSNPSTYDWTVASDGVDWVVAFQSTDSSNGLHAVKVTADGVVHLPAVEVVPQDYFMRFHLRLAYANGVYLLAFANIYDSQGIRFDANLNLLDSQPFALLTYATPEELVSNGSQFYLIWREQQPDFSMAVMGSRLDTNGVKLDGSGDIISLGYPPDGYTIADVTWDLTNWRVNWSSSSTTRVARVNSAGDVLDPGGVVVPGPTSGYSAGSPNGGIVITWDYITGWVNEVFTAFISAANTPSPNRAVSTSAPSQSRPDVAAGSAGYMLVYRSSISGVSRVMAQPLDASGNPLIPQPVQLDSGLELNTPTPPSVAWNGSLYLVTWSGISGIYAQRINQDGSLVDPLPVLTISLGFGPTDVAAVGDTFLVLGRKFGYTPEVIFPVGARVRGSDGVILDPSPLSLGPSYARSTALTTFGGRWLVVTHSTYTHDDPIGTTSANFVNADGSVGTNFGIYGPYSMGGNGINEVAAASNGTNALVLQSVEYTSGVETDLIASLVNSDGSVQPGIDLTPWAGNQYRARAAWDGSQYVVVYNDQKNRFAPWTMDAIDASSDLFGMRLSSTGTIIDPQGFAFSTSTTGEAHPNITAASGLSLISEALVRNASPFDTYRVGYQFLGAGGNQWPVAIVNSSTSGGDIPLPVSFSSAGSTDPDGSLTAYAWDFGDGGSSSVPNPNHTFTVPGNYVVTLTVTDNLGAQTTNTVAIAATAPNQLPIAVASADRIGGPAPLDVTFFAAGSYDPDGGIGNFEWNFGDGNTYWGSTAYNTFYTNGVYQVTLTVYDSRGATGTDTLTIYVGENVPPVAVASADVTDGLIPLHVNFSSAGSNDPDGSIVSYAWDFQDGHTSLLPNPDNLYDEAGLFNVTLTVTDNLGATDTATLPIRARAFALSPDQAQSGGPGETITYTVTITNAPGALADTFTITPTITGAQWVTTVPTQVGPVSPGASATVPVAVHIPAQVHNGVQSTATLTFTSQNDDRNVDQVALTSTAQVSYGVQMTPPALAQSGAPGSMIEYTLLVTNTSQVSEDFNLTAVSNWLVHFPVTSLSLAPSASAQVTVHVTIPIGATNGQSDTATITVRSVHAPAVSAQSQLTTTAVTTQRWIYLPLAMKTP